jgi:hypothetical protein
MSGAGTPCSEISKPGATLHIEGLPVAHADVPVEQCSLRLGDPVSMKTGRRCILYGKGGWPVCTGESTTHHGGYAIPGQSTVFLGGVEAPKGSPEVEQTSSADVIYETLRRWINAGQPAASIAAQSAPLAGAFNTIGAIGLRAAAPGLARGLLAYVGGTQALSRGGEAIDPEGPNGPLASAYKEASGRLPRPAWVPRVRSRSGERHRRRCQNRRSMRRETR